MTTTSNHLIFETKLRQRMIASMWAVAFLYPAWYYPCFKFFNAQEDLLGRCIVAVGAGLLALYFIFNKKLSLKKMEALFAGFVFLYTCQLLYLCNLNHWSFIYVLGCSMHCITVFPHVKNKKNLEYSFFAFLIVNLLMGYYYQVPTKDLIISEINIFIIFLCLSYLQYQNRILQNLLDSTLDDLAFSEKVRMQSAKLAALGTLAGGVAHEINNPMSIILGKTNLIARTVAKSDYTSSKLPEAFSKIEQTLSRMTEILKGLMIFAKNEYEEKENKISLLSLIQKSLDQLDANIKNPNTKIEVDVPSHLNIFADEVKMQQAFTALLKNAFQAAQVALEAWVKITANALPGSQQISIQIQDSGSGIKPEVAEKMMIPFFTTKDIGQGTGLGLSIAKGVFEQHEGQLEYLATEKNTTFNVTLPTTTIDLTAASPISINSDIPSQAA